ncbi:magnesium-protoporphyrin IX monomethyl ester anaerobic oxidative cyclase [Lysobacter silvisoli]|uniref:Magnesium-protoporphyrin IX monomethyl ester anaerobic oxidative cyclase n=1 Tax=Lysobacter silvisoli TaxID=2293254 RepID=A0A371K6C7_9GAMM|nr:magnesium-protoporphyrin IX monomethyl ester anaerobic oxidative cyclase [Lysobacter silvisoli]RDZ29509.1 magnesium-protoporphyrin IX monomethyl ester anaerobic oxidative cyclase [Lysobacter silvisoli]
MSNPSLRILLLNPPHTAIGSRVPREQLPPLGLLSIGGPLLDAGFAVELLDAEFGPLSVDEVVRRVLAQAPDVLMLGHSGSTSAHPTVAEICARLKRARPALTIVYGGVFPTYHWRDVLLREPAIDVIVRGEGERTALRLMQALARGENLAGVPGLAYRRDGTAVETGQAEMILDLDEYRVGWELIDHDRYSYWGGMKAVVVQFSRGCPYLCSYCGQRGFWSRWRHRDPVKFARELARLHREHGVRLINFADELPTGSRKAWQAFLEALIAENVDLTLVGSTRAGDIVRDADILHLYKRAGVIRFLLGIESYSEATLQKIRKGASVSEDREAIRLLRAHGIISMATYVVGFDEESDRDYWHSLRHLLRYDPDQIQLLYVTPHRWTPYYDSVADRPVIQTDARKWDYKHQVLATSRLRPWRVLLWVKAIEAIVQLRPRALYRSLLHPDREVLKGMRWYVRMGRRVWLREVLEFCFRGGRTRQGPTVAEFWGESLAQEEYALAKPARRGIAIRTLQAGG